jgi:hypothetical protein
MEFRKSLMETSANLASPLSMALIVGTAAAVRADALRTSHRRFLAAFDRSR